MNRGLLLKAWRESWPATLLTGLGVGLAEVVLVYMLWELQEQLPDLLARLAFVQKLLQTLLGAKVGVQIGPETLQVIAWVHPLVLGLLGAHAIIFCTRVPAGEVDRGTVDLLLALPVSRWQLYRAEAVVWILSGGVALMLGVLGNVLGNRALADRPPIDPRRFTMILVNLFGMGIWVGGLACLVSSLSDRRGKAVAVTWVVVVLSFLWNYLAQFWSVAERLASLSFMNYYRPLAIMRDASWPLTDLAVLYGCGFIFWLVGGWCFSRRDLATS